MSKPKQRFSREVTCANCGRKAVHHRPYGRFCAPKCRVENFWKRKLGVVAEAGQEPRPGTR